MTRTWRGCCRNPSGSGSGLPAAGPECTLPTCWCSGGGSGTIWDVRPVEKQDEKFVENRDLTEPPCVEVGWLYSVYGGASPVRRNNLRWLTAYRREMP